MINAVTHDGLPVIDGVIQLGGVPGWRVRHLPTHAVIDDEAPLGSHLLFLVVGDDAVYAERCAELLRRHGLADVPEDAAGAEL